MTRPYKYCCEFCVRSQTNKPGYTVCQRCNNDQRALSQLADLIRRARPAQQLTPTPLLLARMWEAFVKSQQPEALPAASALVQRLQRGEQMQLEMR